MRGPIYMFKYDYLCKSVKHKTFEIVMLKYKFSRKQEESYNAVRLSSYRGVE